MAEARRNSDPENEVIPPFLEPAEEMRGETHYEGGTCGCMQHVIFSRRGDDEGEHRARKPMRLTVRSVSEEFDDRYCTRLANTQCYQVGSRPSSFAGSRKGCKTSFSGS